MEHHNSVAAGAVRCVTPHALIRDSAVISARDDVASATSAVLSHWHSRKLQLYTVSNTRQYDLTITRNCLISITNSIMQIKSNLEYFIRLSIPVYDLNFRLKVELYSPSNIEFSLIFQYQYFLIMYNLLRQALRHVFVD